MAVDTCETVEGVGEVKRGYRGVDVGTEMERLLGGAWEARGDELGLGPTSNLEMSSLLSLMVSCTGA